MSFQRRKILRALLNRDFAIFREGKNLSISKDAQGNMAVLPRHTQVNRMTARSMANSAGIPWSEFVREVR